MGHSVAEGPWEEFMSKNVVAEDIRLRLAQSMPAVERARSEITKRIQDHLQRMETPEEAFGQAEISALMLMDLLFDGARDLAAFGELRNLERVAREHRRLDIDGRHYSRFGTALAPVLREVLGVSLPPGTASAWCDAFWLIVGRIRDGDPLKEGPQDGAINAPTNPVSPS